MMEIFFQLMSPIFYVEIIAKIENLIEISSNSKIELIKTAYHLGIGT